MNFCVNCKFYSRPADALFERCTHESAKVHQKFDPVSGMAIPIYCNLMRMDDDVRARENGQCGESGMWFEAANPATRRGAEVIPLTVVRS